MIKKSIDFCCSCGCWIAADTGTMRKGMRKGRDSDIEIICSECLALEQHKACSIGHDKKSKERGSMYLTYKLIFYNLYESIVFLYDLCLWPSFINTLENFYVWRSRGRGQRLLAGHLLSQHLGALLLGNIHKWGQLCKT